MPKTPRYAEHGLTRVGKGKYVDQAGNPVSERQMRKLVGTPAKGSPGNYEYKKAKYGEEFAGKPPREKGTYQQRLAAFLKKTPGGTEEWFKTGKRPEIPGQRTLTEHNRLVDKQRRESLQAQRKAGLITEKQYYERAAQLRLEKSYRDKIVAIEDKIRLAKNMTTEQYLKMRREIETLKKQYNKYNSKIERENLIPQIDAFKYGYYHGGTDRLGGSRRKAS